MVKKKTTDINVEDKISDGFNELAELVDDTITEWEKYVEKGVKKSAKTARKMSLDIKKKAAEVRGMFGDLFSK